MSDISDDENSPNYAAINGPASLGDAQRALAFIGALQSGASSSTGFSTNVDMVANALGRNANFPPSPTSESNDDETRSQAMQRYMSSRRSEVSDPGTMVTRFPMKALRAMEAMQHSKAETW